jgi:hypothetical protein
MAYWDNVLAPARAINWYTAGAVITHRTSVFEPDGSGYTLASGATAAQINDHINRCPVGSVVLLGPGTYACAGTAITMKAGVTLRGSGTLQTTITFSGSGFTSYTAPIACGSINSNNWLSPQNSTTWTAADYSKGQTQITLAANYSTINTGQQLFLDLLNEEAATGWFLSDAQAYRQDTVDFGRANRRQVQVVIVTGRTGAVVDFTPGLYFPNARVGLTPGVWWATALPFSNAGFEDMTIDFRSMTSDPESGIGFYNANNCWVARCRLLNLNVRRAVNMSHASHITVRDSYCYGGTGQSQSYAITGMVGASDCLAENNILQHCTGAIVHEGAFGFVGSYNFILDDYYAISAGWNQPSLYAHHAGDAMVLWEGNIAVGMANDNIHGPGNCFTGFRNFLYGKDIGADNKVDQTQPATAHSFHRWNNYVGNVLGTPGYHTIYAHPFPTTATQTGTSDDADVSIFVLGYGANRGTYSGSVANDPLTATSALIFRNWNSVEGAEHANQLGDTGDFPGLASPTTTLPSSFYLSAKPSWWGVTGQTAIPWPAIGPDVTGGNLTWGSGAQADLDGHVYKIPAKVVWDTQGGAIGSILAFDPSVYASGSASPPVGTPVLSVR